MARRLFHYGASLLLVQGTLACTQQPPAQDVKRGDANAAVEIAPQPPAADTKLVVAFGDSLYAGYQLEPDQGFAPALERALAARGIKAIVFNAGISGDTSAAGRQRLAFMLDGLPRKPDLVIVGLGGNDVLRGLRPEVTRANLDAILADLRKRRIETLLTGMMAAPNLGPDFAAAFNPIYPELAKKYGVKLYPFFLDGVMGEPGMQLADGMHPNDRGVRTIVARVLPMIARELQR